MLAGAELRKVGIERIRIIDQAGGIGGTWYWNRYPGVMCDVESYIYMPMLEELDYVPTQRYAFGEEIMRHLEAVADRFDLVADALFHTGVTHAEWHEDDARWRSAPTGRRRAHLPMVRPGHRDPQPHEAARHSGHGVLRRALVPHGSVGLRLHRRRSARAAHQPGGQDRRPHRHRGERHPVRAAAGRVGQAPLCVPAHAVGHRRAGQPPDGPRLCRRAQARWQQARMDNFQAIMSGKPVEVDLVDDGWTHHYAAVQHPPDRQGMAMADYARNAEEIRLPDHGRAPPTGRGARGRPRHGRDPQALLPVSLQEAVLPRRVPAGIQQPQRHADRLPCRDRTDHPSGARRQRKQYDVDCIIYGTGFEAEVTPLFRRPATRSSDATASRSPRNGRREPPPSSA